MDSQALLITNKKKIKKKQKQNKQQQKTANQRQPPPKKKKKKKKEKISSYAEGLTDKIDQVSKLFLTTPNTERCIPLTCAVSIKFKEDNIKSHDLDRIKKKILKRTHWHRPRLRIQSNKEKLSLEGRIYCPTLLQLYTLSKQKMFTKRS